MLAGMREVEFFKWWLPPPPGRKQPYLSSWVMTAQDAAQRGALRPEPSTRVVRQMAESPQEVRQVLELSDTSKHGSGWNGKPPE